MKRAVAQCTCKINRAVYHQGATFEPPYPPGWQKEINSGSGLILEFDDTPAPGEQTFEDMDDFSNPDDDLNQDDGPAFESDSFEDTQLEGNQSENDLTKSPKEETEAEKKKRLEIYAREKFGINIDRRKKVETIEVEIAELEARYAKENKKSLESESKSETELESEIGNQDIDNL